MLYLIKLGLGLNAVLLLLKLALVCLFDIFIAFGLNALWPFESILTKLAVGLNVAYVQIMGQNCSCSCCFHGGRSAWCLFEMV